MIDRIVFILGTPYCGSSILANILSTGQGVFNCGEIDRIESVGHNENTCEHCQICEVAGRECPVFTPTIIESVRGSKTPSGIYETLHAITGAPVLLDGSKHAYWMRMMVTDPSVRAKSRAILLVKNPVGFVASYLKRRPDMQNEIWRIPELWRDTYVDLLRSLHAQKIPFTIVRQEDFSTDAARVIPALADWCGIRDVDLSGDYDFTQAHALGGNRELAEQTAFNPHTRLASGQDVSLTDLRRIVMQAPGLYDLASITFGYHELTG